MKEKKRTIKFHSAFYNELGYEKALSVFHSAVETFFDEGIWIEIEDNHNAINIHLSLLQIEILINELSIILKEQLNEISKR